MRILVMTQYFWPENFRVNDLSTELVKRGHDVTVLTGEPNYPEGKVFESYRENPNNFSSYNGCDIVRVPMISRGKGSKVKLVLNYLSYALSASIYGLYKLKYQKFDVIFVFEPSPITVGIPAVIFKKTKKAPIVFWVLDLWPETLKAVGIIKSKQLLRSIGALTSYIYNHCDLVLGQSKAFIKSIEERCSEHTKVKYFPSWSEEIFQNKNIKEIPEIPRGDSFFNILFAGNIGEAQDFPAILATLALLKQKTVSVRLFIVGAGRAEEWLKDEIEKKSLQEYVFFLGRYPLEDMPSFYSASDALLVSLQKNKTFAMTIPGKVQTYMASGKPLLGMLDGEGARVINESRGGYACGSGDSEGLVNLVIKMSNLTPTERQVLGMNAERYAKKEFNRGNLISQLEDWFYEVSESKKLF